MSTHVRIFEDRLLDLAADEVEEVVLDAMLDGVDGAQRLVPIDTGELHDGIRIVDEPHRDGSGVVGTYGVTDVDHAEPVEFGTERMAAQPYLRPSIDAMKQGLR